MTTTAELGRPRAAASLLATREPLYVEVSPLLERRCTGIARFTSRLVEALARRVSLRLVCTLSREEIRGRGLRPDLVAGQEIVIEAGTLVSADAGVEPWARRLLQMPRRACARQRARHACVFTQLRPAVRQFRREIGLFYDFTPVLLPWVHGAGTRDLFGRYFADTSGLCDKVVAISGATQGDARWLSAQGANDVVLGYPGPSLCVAEHAWPRAGVRAGRVILVVATREPRKNGDFLLDWFRRTRVLNEDVELWWVGPAGWLCAEPRPRVGRRIRYLGTVSDAELCRLYQYAAFTVSPSLYEGFGFPVLDALRHGAPVLCGFHSALREFAGPGVFYFDPCDAASLDAACRDLLACRPGAFSRPELDTRFSWDRLAQTVLNLTE